MNRISKSSIKKLLEQYNLKPNKQMGQNFLINEMVLKKIVNTADISENDIVLEIGSGLGGLTHELALKAKKVIAIEKDKNIAEALKRILKNHKNIEIIQGDILKLSDNKTLLSLSDYKITANIPYYLTSALIRLFLESKNPPQEIVLLIQKQVAQRICAKPPKMSLLAVSVQFYSCPKIISRISKESFWPKPKVDSAILKIGNIKKPKNINAEKFFQIVKAGFSAPRKQLANNLSKELKIDREKIKKALIKCEIDTQIRAENIKVEDWKKITSVISAPPLSFPGLTGESSNS
ncbi:MAG: 16S rRNA (adenine(1518)-N(6)/adenine(1519)-N(6))-dimethyltransferase RsmA [bacterium]